MPNVTTVNIPITTPGQLLSAYRIKANVTQAELAEAIDASAQSVHNIENDKQTPGANLWAAIVSALNIPAAQALQIWVTYAQAEQIRRHYEDR